MISRALVRLALLATPAEFRRRRGDELLGVALQRLDEERRERGPLNALRYALGAALDLLLAAGRLRRDDGARRVDAGDSRLPPTRIAPGPASRPPRSAAARRGGMIDQIAQDLRLAVRALRARPLFTSVAVLSLALGIGANSAVFNLVDAVMLRSLPVEAPDRLVVPLEDRGEGRFNHNFSYPDFVDFQRRSRTLAGLVAYSPAAVSFGVDERSERATGLYVSGNYFDVLGVGAEAGRTFRPEEYRSRGTHPVVVISDRYWRSRFAAAPEAVGAAVTINGHPFTIIGVAAAGFTGTRPGESPAFFLPFAMYDETVTGRLAAYRLLDNRSPTWLYLIGRLAPGTSGEQAQTELDAIAAALAEEYPDSNANRLRIALMPGTSGRFGALDNLTTPLVSVMVVVVLLLLIACANVANLMLVRASGREREMAVRLALGARRARLIRQLLTESVALGGLGGLIGIAVAAFGSRLLLDYLRALSDATLYLDVGVGGRVLAFTAGLSLLASVGFGLVPALRASRSQLTGALKEGGAAVGGKQRRWGGASLHNGLVVAQVALSFALLIGAGLLVRSVVGLGGIDPGFDAGSALVMGLDAGLAGYDADRARRLFNEIIERVETLPGVEAAAFARAVPIDLGGTRGGIFLPGRSEPMTPEIDQNAVSSEFFDAVGIPIVRGRPFDVTDTAKAPLVAIVNQTFAETYWPGDDPLGKQIGLAGPDGPRWEIVAVAADGKYRRLREAPQPYVYLSLPQVFRSDVYLVVRTAVEPMSVMPAVREAVAAIDPELPLYDPQTLADKVAASYFETRITAWLLGLFSVIGVLLAGSGLYGVLAFATSQRVREIGVRMALGARSRSIVRLVLARGLTLVATGMVLGVALALSAAGFLGALLYGVGAADPLTLVSVAALLTAIGLAACSLPAWRATRIDPVSALRRE